MISPASTTLVFLDLSEPAGRLADASLPQLLVTDEGATRGDGVFETMLAVGGSVRKIQAHLDRLAGSASALDLEIPSANRWRRAIATGLSHHRSEDPPERPAGDELVVKLVVTRGVESSSPVAWVQVSAVKESIRRQRETGINVILLARGYDSRVLSTGAPWLLLGAKTLSYALNMAALRHAHKEGADDVIFYSSDGSILEGPTSTVLLARVDGDSTPVKHLITPQLDSGILPGTSQGELFKAAKVAGWELGFGPLKPQDLLAADAVWLISSVRMLVPVNRIDGHAIGTPELQKELTAELNRVFAGID